MAELDDIVRDFLLESGEGLDRLDRDFVALEQNPADSERIASIFRCIHTIKGTCSFLGFPTLESVTHSGESLLVKLRDGSVTLTTDMASTLLALVDAVRGMLAAIESTGSDGGGDYSALLRRLQELQQGGGRTVARDAPPPQEPLATTPTEVGAEMPDTKSPQLSDSTLRVDIGLLDRLMNLVGELVLARNQILQHTAGVKDPAFTATSARLNLITTELQEGVMKTRMQPIGNVWNKLPRLVRDLANAGGKHVRLEVEGKETELDKTIIESIKDPLTHLVRNSVDHGLELPEDRRAAGKNPEGCVRLRAYHEGGQVNIEISDDGGGIHVDRVRAKALQKGLVTPDQLARMGERELLNLIFLPGFSTAEKVTNVSGRGVGMDVVKTNVEKIGGTVDVQSVPGSGTTFKIKIPLTLAIIPALIVTTSGERYAIPQVSLLELVRLGGEQAQRNIELIHGAPVYRLRGRLLPLVYLDRALGLVREDSGQRQRVNIVVLRADDRQFGLVVDAVNDSEEIVVKPLGRHLKGISTFAGATIMGDGTVALILDVLGLAQASAVVSGQRDTGAADAAGICEEVPWDRQTILIANLGESRRVAIPLTAVARLEEFPVSDVELSGGREVIQYRGRIMPIIRVAEILNVSAPPAESDMLQVVVHTVLDQSFGFVVDNIVDIVEERIAQQSSGSGAGITGAAVIQGRVTDLLNLEAVILLAGYEDPVAVLSA